MDGASNAERPADLNTSVALGTMKRCQHGSVGYVLIQGRHSAGDSFFLGKVVHGGDVKGWFLFSPLFCQEPQDPLASGSEAAARHHPTAAGKTLWGCGMGMRFGGTGKHPVQPAHQAEVFGASTLSVSQCKACVPAHPPGPAFLGNGVNLICAMRRRSHICPCGRREASFRHRKQSKACNLLMCWLKRK